VLETLPTSPATANEAIVASGLNKSFGAGDTKVMMQMTAMFAGILNRAYANVTNIGARMWIMDPGVNTATSPIPLPNYLEDAVRSMDGVSFAVPIFVGGGMVKLPEGTYQAVNVVGLDDDSLFGRPSRQDCWHSQGHIKWAEWGADALYGL
jgi:hypothetical protein